jgi:hypothetical protein
MGLGDDIGFEHNDCRGKPSISIQSGFIWLEVLRPMGERYYVDILSCLYPSGLHAGMAIYPSRQGLEPLVRKKTQAPGSICAWSFFYLLN